MIGQTISHYKILEKLGEGGMGVVYKAYDAKLKRTVALKFLSPHLLADEQHRKRFMHEAQAAAGLTHPHICTIHEVHETDGHTFMVMEYIEGESLRQKIEAGALDVSDVLDIVIQITKGLARAQDLGIVHRDIKPGNILMTADGDAKIVDFGLAKLAAQTKLTKTGVSLGTVSYMSPEQATGEDVDHRTDIWALGVMLYEMLTGKLPFRGDYEQAVVYLILNEDPEPITSMSKDTPIALEEIVEKALAKNPEKRYATVNEFLAVLEELRDRVTLGIKERRFTGFRRLRRRKRMVYGTSAIIVLFAAALISHVYYSRSMAMDSIAVLPLENLSGNPNQEYLADGITMDLINSISKISGFKKVISRKSAMQYKGTDKPLAVIARELDVKAFVAGTVQPVGEKMKIAVELIHAVTGENLWSETFEKDMRGIQTLSSSIARAVVGEVNVELTPQEEARLASVRLVDPEAYNLYLKGLYQLEKVTLKGTEKAIDYFQKAIEADPNYAEAFAMLACGHFGRWYFGVLPLEQASSMWDPPLQKALEIDDMLPEAHYVIAQIKHYFDWDWEGAELSYKRTIALDPSIAGAHSDYAFLLMAVGRSAEAIAEAKRAQQLDPLSYPTILTLEYAYTSARQYDNVMTLYREMTELEPNDYIPYQRLMYQYERMGKYEDAIKARQKWKILQGNPPEKVAVEIATLDSAFNESGSEGYWRWHLEDSKAWHDRAPYVVAKYYACLGDKNQAFACLEKAYKKRDGFLHMVRYSDSWDSLRDDPRFNDLLRKMNLPEIEVKK